MRKEFTWEEVANHNKEDDLHVVIDDKVYNVTEFQKEHPGGGDLFLDQAAQDVTELFEAAQHSNGARDLLRDLQVGVIRAESKTTMSRSKESQGVVMSASSKARFTLYSLLAAAFAALGYNAFWYSTYTQEQDLPTSS